MDDNGGKAGIGLAQRTLNFLCPEMNLADGGMSIEGSVEDEI